MKRFVFLVLLPIATLFVVQNAFATIQDVNVTFDFDDAPYMGGAAGIEAYMEGIYGSDITVTGGVVGDGWSHGPLYNYPGDRYIQAGPGWGTYEFSFSFIAEPITSVSFDWGVRLNEFHVLADEVEIFSSPGGWDCWAWGNSGTIDLRWINQDGITTLTFRDSCLGEIEVDDLVVTTSVPEPATISLFGIAALALLRKRTPWDKRRFHGRRLH